MVLLLSWKNMKYHYSIRLMYFVSTGSRSIFFGFEVKVKTTKSNKLNCTNCKEEIHNLKTESTPRYL